MSIPLCRTGSETQQGPAAARPLELPPIRLVDGEQVGGPRRTRRRSIRDSRNPSSPSVTAGQPPPDSCMVHVHAKTSLTEPVRHRVWQRSGSGRGLVSRGHVTGRSARGDEHQGVTVPGAVCGWEPRWEPHGRTTFRFSRLTRTADAEAPEVTNGSERVRMPARVATDQKASPRRHSWRRAASSPRSLALPAVRVGLPPAHP